MSSEIESELPLDMAIKEQIIAIIGVNRVSVKGMLFLIVFYFIINIMVLFIGAGVDDF
jgi:hypothetical protein